MTPIIQTVDDKVTTRFPSLLQLATPIFPSYCGYDKNVSIEGAFTMILNAAAAHSELIGTGCAEMKANRLFWLMVRSRIRFHRRPSMMEEATLTTWPSAPGHFLCDRCYTLSEGEELLLEARNEWAVLNIDTQKPIRTEQIYPEELLTLERRVLPEPFRRMRDDFTEEEEVGKVTVQPSDIDFGQHVNNERYLHMLTNTLPLSSWQSLTVREVEVQYVTPCLEGETLTIYRREEADGFSFAIRKPDGKCALLSYFTLA